MRKHASYASSSLCLAIAVATGPAYSQSVFTIAGGGTDDGRPATVAVLDIAQGVAVDHVGNVFIADQKRSRIRRISAATGIIGTYAGNGSHGFAGDGGPATLATLNGPRDIALDAAGNLFIVDSGNHRLRRVEMSSGTITTWAGKGIADGSDFAGDGGPATLATLLNPVSIAFDAPGNLYVVDAGHQRLRKIDASPQHVITTVAGNGEIGSGGDGGPATMASFRFPDGSLIYLAGLAVDASGSVYIADPGDHRVRKIDGLSGRISAFAGNASSGFAGDGGLATLAQLACPQGIAISSEGDIYIADNVNGRVRRVARLTGVISTVAGASTPDTGDGGSATLAHIRAPAGIAFDGSGNLFITEGSTSGSSSLRRVLASNGLIETVAGGSSQASFDEGGPATAAVLQAPVRLAVSAEGDLIIAEGAGYRVRSVSAATGKIETIAGSGPGSAATPGDGGPATKAGLIPCGVTFDADGNLLICDRAHHTVRRVDAASDIITTIAGNGIDGFGGDGGPATAASLSRPMSVAVDRSGNLLIADTGNNRVRRVSGSAGTISTVAGNGQERSSGDGGPATAASLTSPYAVVVDNHSNILVGEFGASGIFGRVRRIDGASGNISTIAGGGDLEPGDGSLATAAQLIAVADLAVDQGGDVLIAEAGAMVVRRIEAATGMLRTLAGTRSVEASLGDAGPASRACLTQIQGILVTSEGDILIADTGGNRVRRIPACTPVAEVSLLVPSDSSTGVSLNGPLEWAAPKGAHRYDVVLDRTNPPVRVVAENLSTTSYTPADLDPLTTYYWRVVARGDPFCRPLSARQSQVRSFTTESACRPPEPFVHNRRSSNPGPKGTNENSRSQQAARTPSGCDPQPLVVVPSATRKPRSEARTKMVFRVGQSRSSRNLSIPQIRARRW